MCPSRPHRVCSLTGLKYSMSSQLRNIQRMVDGSTVNRISLDAIETQVRKAFDRLQKPLAVVHWKRRDSKSHALEQEWTLLPANSKNLSSFYAYFVLWNRVVASIVRPSMTAYVLGGGSLSASPNSYIIRVTWIMSQTLRRCSNLFSNSERTERLSAERLP